MKVSKVQPRKLSPQMQKLDKKLKQASQLYEKQFLRQMVKAMRQSVSHSAMTKPGMAENIYREQLDDKYVDSWVHSGGTGFGDMIYSDLVEKFFPQLGRQAPKQIRPTDLSDRYQGISRSLTSKAHKKQTFNIQLGPQLKNQSYLKLPWKGTLEKEFDMGNGQSAATFSHPLGLKSTFVFQGKLQPGLLNKSLAEGENFAQLSPGSQNMTWQIQDADSRKDSSGEENSSFN